MVRPDAAGKREIKKIWLEPRSTKKGTEPTGPTGDYSYDLKSSACIHCHNIKQWYTAASSTALGNFGGGSLSPFPRA
jgi:hypothetical protein